MSVDIKQATAALASANTKRTKIADLRRRARRNPQAVIDALTDPPEYAHHITVLELLAMARSTGMRATAIEHVGYRAINDGINLLVPLGRASATTRYWACLNGLEWVHGYSRVILPDPPPQVLGEVDRHPMSPYNRTAVAA